MGVDNGEDGGEPVAAGKTGRLAAKRVLKIWKASFGPFFATARQNVTVMC